MKFLVVADSSIMRSIIVRTLNDADFHDTVEEAANGTEALAKFNDSIQFVIVDWFMPNDISGEEFVKALRAREDGKTVPILMVTTRPEQRNHILGAREAGVNNYIVKPLTPRTLKEKIDSITVS